MKNKFSMGEMSIPQLVTIINLAADELKRRKLPVIDRDSMAEFYKVTILGGKVYALFPKGK